MRGPSVHVALLCLAFLAVRAASALVVSHPGYTDAYYYALVAQRLAHGQGLTADFVWNYVELHDLALPLASHRFWMPLSTVVQAGGIALLEPLLGAFRAGQAALILVAAAIPAVAYAAARSLAASHRGALVAAALAGLGGAFAPGWVSTDSFALAAVIGTGFFVFYQRAARGSVRDGIVAGACVGLLYLARSEGALFGLALLALRSRAGLAGAGTALAIGIAWQLRQYALGPQPDLVARAVLLVRYQDFFALSASPTLAAYLAAWPEALRAKGEALATNAVTFAFAFLLLGVPGIVRAARDWWLRPVVRAWVGLALLVYLAESLLFTLHSTRGSYFHSLAAFFPFGIALATIGTTALLRDRARIAAAATLAGAAAVSAFAVVQWDASFTPVARARAAAVDRIPTGAFYAIDAAAWRWISGRPVLVTPADAEPGECLDGAFGRLPLVLERPHFSVYDALYATAREIGDGIRIVVREPSPPGGLRRCYG